MPYANIIHFNNSFQPQRPFILEVGPNIKVLEKASLVERTGLTWMYFYIDSCSDICHLILMLEWA